MISLLLLLLTVLMSGVFTRVGAIALELTGMPDEQAGFQALSAFSGVGFTTREAEFALEHPQRRKIISALIKLGNAGIITTLITLGGTLLSGKSIIRTFSSDRRWDWLPLNMPIIILLFSVLSLFFLSKALRRPSVSRVVKEVVAAVLLKTKLVKPLSIHEVLVNGNGYGIFQIEISSKNPLAGKTALESRLKQNDIKLLYLNRLSESINSPDEHLRLEVGDIAAFYGPVTAIRDYCVDLIEENRPEELDQTLAIGAHAPAFTLNDQNNRKISLSDFHQKKNLIIVFYPKDKSFFCTTQLKTLSDHLSEVRGLETEVVAINQESMSSHAGFCDSSNLKFSLLSDSSKEVCKAYKALIFGGLLVDRTVYILDKNSKVRYAQRGKPSIARILAVVRQIETAEKGYPDITCL